MKINLNIHNIMTEEQSAMAVLLDDGATINDLLREIGYGSVSFSKYYPFSDRLLFGDAYLPFVISDGRILYDVPYNRAKISDFIDTMDLRDKEIEITVGIPWAGGPGLCGLEEMWESAKSALEAAAIFCTLSGVTVASLIQWICQLFKSRSVKPHTVQDLIYSRKCWNHYELADLLEIEPQRAKDMLKVYGFIYDNSKKMYVEAENIDEVKLKFTNVKGLAVRRKTND